MLSRGMKNSVVQALHSLVTQQDDGQTVLFSSHSEIKYDSVYYFSRTLIERI